MSPKLRGSQGVRLGLAIAAFFIVLFVITRLPQCDCLAWGAKPDRTEFIKGYDYGKVFLGAKKKKGKKYRRNVYKQIVRWLPVLWKYMRYEIVAGGSRALLESRGNWYSHTNDTTIFEAAMMSNGYSFTRWVCLEYGICGDPCGDPQFSIGLAGLRRYLARQRMLYSLLNEEGGENFWHPWLLEQCMDNRFECEAFMGGCGAINCQKLRMAVVYSGVHKSDKVGKDGKIHKWWAMINYLRAQDAGKIAIIFHPKKQLWKIGSRLGRVVDGLLMRPEFYEQPEPKDGHEPKVNYGWDDAVLVYFPFRTEIREVEGIPVAVQVPDLPKPLFPTGPKFMPKSEWRKRCVLYGRTKAWRTATGEPKNPKETYKKTACRDGVCWKKGQRKYPTRADFDAAHAAWVDVQQALGVLPKDEEYEQTHKEMAEAGYVLVNPVPEA